MDFAEIKNRRLFLVGFFLYAFLIKMLKKKHKSKWIPKSVKIKNIYASAKFYIFLLKKVACNGEKQKDVHPFIRYEIINIHLNYRHLFEGMLIWMIVYTLFYIKEPVKFDWASNVLNFDWLLRLACSNVPSIFGKNSLKKQEIAFCFWFYENEAQICS